MLVIREFLLVLGVIQRRSSSSRGRNNLSDRESFSESGHFSGTGTFSSRWGQSNRGRRDFSDKKDQGMLVEVEILC